MARPESISDIELENIEFANIEVDKITLDSALLKGYTAFLEATTKVGAIIDKSTYRGVSFMRRPTLSEMESQLRTAQSSWDDGKRCYEILASVGETEYSYQRSQAQTWAEKENMPFPPEHEPISDFHATIKAIDEVTA
jgi:hypothetical protein